MNLNYDVVMLTKNSEPILDNCLTSLYESFPVNNLIIVDGISTDRTLKILAKYPRVKIFSCKGTRAEAREEGIKQVETEWFLFLDSDVILCKDWFKKVKTEMKEDVGAIWGLIHEPIPHLNKFIFEYYLHIHNLAFQIRGGCHDSLIRTKLMKHIIIPGNLHAFEDSFIADRIKKRGYKFLVSNQAYCFHIRPKTDWNLNELLKNGKAEFEGMVNSRKFSYLLLLSSWLLYAIFQVRGSMGDQNFLEFRS